MGNYNTAVKRRQICYNSGVAFLFKTLLWLAIIAVVGGFLVNQFPVVKQTVLEYINPAIKEGRLLAKIGATLSNLEINIQNTTPASPAAAAKLEQSKALVSQAKDALQQIDTINQQQQQSGIVSQAVQQPGNAFLMDAQPRFRRNLSIVRMAVSANGLNIQCLPRKAHVLCALL